MTILEYLAEQRKLAQSSPLEISDEKFTEFQEEAKGKLKEEGKSISAEAQAEAQTHGISISDYKIILRYLTNNQAQNQQHIINSVLEHYSRCCKSIDDLIKEENVRQLAQRYGSYQAGAWLMLMNPGGVETEYDENGKAYEIKKATTFVHELFKAGKQKQVIINYFEQVSAWTRANLELSRSYLNLTDEDGKSILDLLREKNNTEQYRDIYSLALDALDMNNEFPDISLGIDTHTASIHASVNSSFVRLAINYDNELVSTHEERVEGTANIDRSDAWINKINQDLKNLETTLQEKLASSKDQAKFQIEKALDFVRKIAKGSEFGNEYTINPKEILSCGLTMQELLAISYQSLDQKEKWQNANEFDSHLTGFIESLYVAMRGYNIDDFGIENDWSEHALKADRNKCMEGCVNQIANGLSDHEDVELRIVNSTMMALKLQQILPLMLIDSVNRIELGKWLFSGLISETLIEEIKFSLSQSEEFLKEFNENEIKDILPKALRILNHNQLRKNILEKLTPEELIKGQEYLINHFVFDEGTEERPGKGYILYLEHLYDSNKAEADKLIKELSRNYKKESLPQAIVILNLLLSGTQEDIKKVISEEFQSFDLNSKNEYLFTAIENCLIKIAELLIKNGADVKAKDEKGYTALLVAANKGLLEIVELLIAKGADINAIDLEGVTALHLAALHKNLEMSKLLIEKGADAKAKDKKGYTALLVAADKGLLEIVELLIENGADINAIDLEGVTALHLAALHKNLEMAKLLIAKGADVNVNVKGLLGASALLHAVNQGSLEIAKLLIEKGADVNAIDCERYSCLHYAAIKGNLEMVMLLVEKGADVKAKDEKGATALHVAAEKGNLETVELLIAKGADVKAKDEKGATALHVAAEKGNLEIIRLLIENRANVNAKDHKKHTALHIAANNGSLETVELLIKNGADVNAGDPGYTALHIAADKGLLKTIELLIANGADVKARDREGATALLVAAEKGNLETVELLIAKGADVKAKDEKGATALHVAAEKGNLEIIRLLIAKGAYVHVKNKLGHTALDYATSNNNLEIVQILKNETQLLQEGKYLFEAIVKNNLEAVKKALLVGINPNICDSLGGDTAIMRAAKLDRVEIVKAFLKKGANPLSFNSLNEDAFDLAPAGSESRRVLEIYIKNKNKVFDLYNQSLLHLKENNELQIDKEAKEFVKKLTKGKVTSEDQKKSLKKKAVKEFKQTLKEGTSPTSLVGRFTSLFKSSDSKHQGAAAVTGKWVAKITKNKSDNKDIKI